MTILPRSTTDPTRTSWTSTAIIVGLPVLLGFVAWLIWLLSDPARWCSVRVTDSKIATSTISDCTSIVLAMIHWLGMYGIALCICVIVAFLVIVTRDLKAGVDLKAPGGFSLRTGGDDAPAAAQAVAGAAQETADAITDAAETKP